LIGYSDDEDALKYHEGKFYADSKDNVALEVFEHFKRLGYSHIEILGIMLIAEKGMEIKLTDEELNEKYIKLKGDLPSWFKDMPTMYKEEIIEEVEEELEEKEFTNGGAVGSKRDSVINYYINNMEDDVLLYKFDINENYLVDRNENYSKIYDIISDELDEEDIRNIYGELNLGDDGGDPYEMADGGQMSDKVNVYVLLKPSQYYISYGENNDSSNKKYWYKINGYPVSREYAKEMADKYLQKYNLPLSDYKIGYLRRYGRYGNGGIMADGGEINDWFEKQRRDIINKSPFHIVVNNFDCAKKIKNKNSQVEIIKLVNPRVKQPISYVLVIKNWANVDELKNIFTECSNHIISYGFTSNEQIDIYREMASRDDGVEMGSGGFTSSFSGTPDRRRVTKANGGEIEFIEKSDEELKGMNDDEFFEYLDAKAAYMKQFARPLSSHKAKNYAANAAAIQYQNEGTSKLDENFPDIQKIKEQSTKDYEETIANRKDKMSEEYKKGGALKYYNKENEYKIGRPSGYIEKEILSRVDSNQEDFVGSFGWKTENKKMADGYLYKLSDFDKELVKDIRLKSGEKIFRYFNRNSAIGGMKPLIKINLDKELLYFLKDSNNIEFETRGVQAIWIALIEHKL
jgi:hypothetical protein